MTHQAVSETPVASSVRDALRSQPRDALERENFAVLMTAQALLGLVDPNMLSVAVWLSGKTLRVRFWVGSQTDAMTETVEDVVADLEAFYSHLADAPQIEPEVVVGAPDSDWHRSPWRMVFAAKIPESGPGDQGS